MKFDEGKFNPEMNMQNRPQAQKEVTREDVEKIFSMEAVYTNKFFVTIQGDNVVRICFADVDPTGTFMTPRYSVTMSFNAFVSFAQLINNNMQNLMKLQQANENTPEKAN